jgi:hypothetical protein
MDRLVPSTTCRCGYASPPTLLRCLGCGRRFARCERTAPRRPRPAASTFHAPPTAFAGRDLQRFAPPPMPAPPVASSVPFGPVAVLGIVAAAWLEPEAPRVELLTVAAVLGAGLAAMRPSPPPALAQPTRTRLTDDELRDALAAW